MADVEQVRAVQAHSDRPSGARCCHGWDWRFYNIVVLGFSFMFLFTAFQTSSMAEKSVLEGAKNETNGTFKGDGYTSLAIIYAVFSGANWLAPSVVSVIGPKISMLVGGVLYSLFIASFLKPMTWALYAGSVLVGLGAAVIWTGQGNFLVLNSDPETMGRNSGIFWALLQCSLLFGNLYVYFAFHGEAQITAESRFTVFSVLTAVSVLGLLTMLLLRTKVRSRDGDLLSQSDTNQTEGPVQALVRSAKLMVTRDMLLLSVTFAYTGLELTFFSGVYGTAVGHTMFKGEESKGLIGLCGIFIGVGEIIGGGLFGLLGKKTNRYGRDPIVLLGYLLHMLCFYLVFLNLPMDSPIADSVGATYINSNKYVALFCAFLLGLGDSSFNTQIYSLLGVVYEDDSAPAIALFKFVQSLTAAAGFFYSQHLLLHWQLLILVISGTGGAFCFFIVEWEASRRYQGGYKQM